MAEDAIPILGQAIPVRFRGYDRAIVDQQLHELRSALALACAERDRAIGRARAFEVNADPALLLEGSVEPSSVSTTVQWLIDTAEQDAQSIRRSAEEEAAGFLDQAERLLHQRIEMIEQAQHEASTEARAIVHEALEQANALLRGLRESEGALRSMFANGGLTRRMPPPRRPEERSCPDPEQVNLPSS